jgi:hypothetical protein
LQKRKSATHLLFDVLENVRAVEKARAIRKDGLDHVARRAVFVRDSRHDNETGALDGLQKRK